MMMERIIAFIMSHPSKEVALKDWPLVDIVDLIIEASNNFSLAIVTSPTDNAIQGVCIATPNHAKRQLYVNAILIQQHTKGVMKHMLQIFKANFSSYIIVAHRKGNWTEYKTPRLTHLLTQLSH